MNKRYNLVSFIILIIGLAVTFFSYYQFKQLDKNRISGLFKGKINERAASFYLELESNLEGLFVVQDMMSDFNPPYLSFKKVSEEIIKRHRGIDYITWIPRITRYQIDTFRVIAARQFRGFRLKEISKKGTLIPIGRYNEYYPFYYIYPLRTQKNLLGISLYPADPDFRELVKAPNKAVYKAFKQLTSLRRKLGDSQYILFFPVYSPTRNRELKGFLAATIDVAAIFSGSIPKEQLSNFNIAITDISNPKDNITVFSSIKYNAKDTDKNEYYLEKKLSDFGGRSLKISAYPTKEYLSSVRNLSPYIIIIVDVLIALMLLILIRRLMMRNLVIEQQNDELEFKANQLEILSNSDALTGLANRRHFEKILDLEWKRSLRESTPITVIMIDIDYFKQYNDTYGHVAGDKCLRNVAQALAKVISRPTDLVARYGGEEFVIILSNTEDREGKVAVKCVKEVTKLKIPHKASSVANYVTISAGSATFAIVPPNLPPRTIVKKADKALYAAKKDGRNRVKILY
jgi:diguanylate cyclase (GGDEF)-like protein